MADCACEGKRLDPIDLYLVSGFLGAGKTTFMQTMIENFAPKKLGVLVNEFGSVGVDGALVRKSGLKLVEINDGSVFCACLKDGFVRTLKAFAQQPIDALLIECSGMADPSAMGVILDGLAPYLERPYLYRGCVCLVDCTTFSDYVDVLMPVQNQVAAADFMIVNKTDLVGKEVLDEVHKLLHVLNGEAYIHDTIYAHVPFELLEEKLVNKEHAPRDCANTPYNRPSTYTLTTGAVCTKDGLEAFYADIMPLMLRMKGFVHAADGWWHVEAVAKQMAVEPMEMDEEDGRLLGTGRLVLISSGSSDIAREICEAWQRHCAVDMELSAS